jgi:small nuclear ribonucleoprotein (snRNP)-like protein
MYVYISTHTFILTFIYIYLYIYKYKSFIYVIGAASLLEQLDKRIMIILRDGRHFVGKLRSFDHFMNLILEETCERVLITGNIYIYENTHINIHIYIYMYINPNIHTCI